MYKSLFYFLIIFLFACGSTEKPLPIIGHYDIVEGDTIYHSIPDFKFINQDSQVVVNNDLADQLYVADFFFTSCPSICPIVKKQMLRIYKEFEDNDKIRLVSHTIDPKRDTPERLKRYAAELNVDTDKWIFLTGDKDSLLEMANEYFVAALEDSEAPGGFDHSGKILLVDTKRHIRSFADGTEADEVTRLLGDINNLLKEYENK